MHQISHAYVALRAYQLLPPAHPLVPILQPHLSALWAGAWLPDCMCGAGQTTPDQHVCKLTVPGTHELDLVAISQALGRGALRLSLAAALPTTWWGQQTQVVESGPGTNVVARVGEQWAKIDQSLSERTCIRALAWVPNNAQSSDAEIALWCGQLSHFLADSCTPPHADHRPLNAYKVPRGFHATLEEEWAKLTGEAFSNAEADPDEYGNLAPAALEAMLAATAAADERLGVSFTTPLIPGHGDVYEWATRSAEISFALAARLAPPETYAYGGADTPTYSEVVGGQIDLLAQVTAACIHDAVVLTALAWMGLT